jgi:DNA modification methylase
MTLYYEQDGIVIYQGKCETVLPDVDPASVALLIADPPYGIKVVEQGKRQRTKDDPGHNGNWTPIEGDTEPYDPAILLLFPRLILFGANHYADKLPPSGSWLVWDKREDATPDANSDAELIWTNLGGPVRTYRQCWRGFTRARDSLEPTKHVHPTQKPVNLMMWLLERYTKPGDLVLDPYMGSGPVARAALLLGRRYIGIELEGRYCKEAFKRLQQAVLPLEMAAD